MTILVTGAVGQLGEGLVRKLRGRGIRVRGTDRLASARVQARGDLRDAPAVVEQYLPGVKKRHAEAGWRRFPAIGRVYDNSAALRDLHWSPHYGFAEAPAAVERGGPPGKHGRLTVPANRHRLYARVTGVVLYFCVMCAAILPMTFAGASDLTPLESLLWERRVVLVFTTASSRTASLDALRARAEALEEREVTWLLIQDGEPMIASPDFHADAPLAAALVAAFQPLSRPLDVVLIGKDGHVKNRVSSLDLEALLDQIDGMPMRRREMRERETAAGEFKR